MQPNSASLSAQPEPPDFHAILRALKFDVEQLQQLSDHSLAFEQELLQLYLEDLQAQLMRLRPAVYAEAWPQVEQITHHIKGASASVGATRLAQLAEALSQPPHQLSSAHSRLDLLTHEFDWMHQQITLALHRAEHQAPGGASSAAQP